MASEPCDACGDDVSIAGGIANIWTMESTPSEGMTLEFEDGSEHFLCFACMAELPDYPSAADVERLRAER